MRRVAGRHNNVDLEMTLFTVGQGVDAKDSGRDAFVLFGSGAVGESNVLGVSVKKFEYRSFGLLGAVKVQISWGASPWHDEFECS